MENTKYQIAKYIIFSLQNGDAVVQNQDSIVIVNNHLMIDMLSNWDRQRVREVSLKEISDYFNDDAKEALEFLTGYNILKEIKPRLIDIDKISILSNHDEVGNFIEKTIREDYGDKFQINSYNLSNLPSSEGKEFLIVFLNPYSKKIGKFLKERQEKNPQSKLIFSYVYNSNFYIDCLYAPEWKVPCHECHIGHIQSQSYLEEDKNMTYQQIIDILYSSEEDFKIEMPLTGLQKINITKLLLNKVYKYVNDLYVSRLHPQELSNCTLLDLSTMKHWEDTSIHWEMCNCYED